MKPGFFAAFGQAKTKCGKKWWVFLAQSNVGARGRSNHQTVFSHRKSEYAPGPRLPFHDRPRNSWGRVFVKGFRSCHDLQRSLKRPDKAQRANGSLGNWLNAKGARFPNSVGLVREVGKSHYPLYDILWRKREGHLFEPLRRMGSFGSLGSAGCKKNRLPDLNRCSLQHWGGKWPPLRFWGSLRIFISILFLPGQLLEPFWGLFPWGFTSSKCSIQGLKPRWTNPIDPPQHRKAPDDWPVY